MKPARESESRNPGSASADQKATRPPGRERVPDHSESSPVVEARVLCLHKRRRSVIHIQEDGVVRRLRTAPEERENIFREGFHATILEQSAVQGQEKFPIPIDDLRNEFGHVDDADLADHLQHPLEAKPETKAADQDTPMRGTSEILTRLLREQDFRRGRGAAHELAAIELDEVIAVVFVQTEPRAIGRARFGKIAEWDHLHEPSEIFRQRRLEVHLFASSPDAESAGRRHAIPDGAPGLFARRIFRRQ